MHYYRSAHHARLAPLLGVAAILSACSLLGACTSGSGGSGAAPTPGSSSPDSSALQGSGSATLSWQAPAANVDGTALTDLAGYYIDYGTDPQNPSDRITIATVGIQTYVIDNLVPGTYYFTVSAYTTTGVEGTPSDMVSKTV
jgi:hypothetical protein